MKIRTKIAAIIIQSKLNGYYHGLLRCKQSLYIGLYIRLYNMQEWNFNDTTTLNYQKHFADS